MFKCPHCKKFNTVKAGLRKNKSGFVQKYFCNDCEKYFIDRHGFENCQTKPEIIVEALDLRAKGMTLGKIVLHINKKYKTNVSRACVLKWQNLKDGAKKERITGTGLIIIRSSKREVNGFLTCHSLKSLAKS